MWTLVNEHDGYRDFEAEIPNNANGVGGTIRITLDGENERVCYGTILWNTADGDEVAHCNFNLKPEEAYQIIGRWTCNACGHEWSGTLGDHEIPEKCHCES